MKKIIFLLFIFSFFLFGCLDANKKLYCCDQTELQVNGVCEMPNGTTYGSSEVNEIDWDAGTANVTIGYKPDGSEITDVLSFCSEEIDVECVDPECNIMLCGQLKYTPYVPGLGETDLTEDTMELMHEQKASGLYGGRCFFVPMDEKVQNIFDPEKKTSAYLNTFRIGAGDSFSEYEYYRYFFPISDKFCAVNNLGTTDRYMNYLMNSEDLNNYLYGDGERYNPEEIVEENFFVTLDTIFLKTSEFGESDGRYVSVSVSRGGGWFSDGNSYLEPDTEFYKKLLYFEYWFEFISQDLKAPYECKDATDCYSMFCNTEDYLRSMCYKEDGGGGNCLCEVKEEDQDASGNPEKVTCKGVEYPTFTWDDELLINEDDYSAGFDLDYENVIDEINYNDDRQLHREICEDFIYAYRNCETCTPHAFYQDLDCSYTSSDSDFADHIPPDIYFTNPNQVEGYTYITYYNFSESALAQSCDMEPGVDYEFISPEEILAEIKDATDVPYYDGWDPGEVPLFALAGGIDDSVPIYSFCGDQYCASYEEGACVRYEFSCMTRYPAQGVRITGLGSCKSDEDDAGFPDLEGFGWCEPCTYLTMPFQEIGTDMPYNTHYETTCNNLGECDSEEIYEQMSGYPKFYQPEYTDFGEEYWDEDFEAYLHVIDQFSLEPELTLFQHKSTEYLQRDMLPIVDFSNNNYWGWVDDLEVGYEVSELLEGSTCTRVASGGYSMQNCFSMSYSLAIDRGPMIIIVADVRRAPFSDSIIPSFETIKKRVRAATYYCDKCLIAVHVTTGVEGAITSDMRMDANYMILSAAFDKDGAFDLSSKKSCDDVYCDEVMLQDLDIVFFDFYPSEQVSSAPCDDDIKFYEHLTSKLTNQSREFLNYFNKPSIAFDFVYTTDGACLTQQRAGTSLSYMLMKQKELTSSGLIGIVFESDFSYPHPTLTSMEYNTRELKKSPPMYMYQRVYSVPEIECVSRDISDDVLETGTEECLNGVSCTVPSGGGASLGYKCPTNTIIEPCQLCSSMDEEISCDLTYSIFDEIHYDLTISELDDTYQDIIANLPDGEVCCLEDDMGNKYSYVSTDLSTSQQQPIMYSKWGDEYLHGCSINQVGELNNFCGVDMPVSINHYKVKCEYS